jgi:hypothetical protein
LASERKERNVRGKGGDKRSQERNKKKCGREDTKITRKGSRRVRRTYESATNRSVEDYVVWTSV